VHRVAVRRRELAAAGVTAHVAEPADTAFARSRERHAKTDRTDARVLRWAVYEAGKRVSDQAAVPPHDGAGGDHPTR
jgi:hypothetical protein